MSEIKDTIQQQVSSHKWLTISIFALIAVLLFLKFYGHDTTKVDDREVRARQDTLDVRDRRRGIEMLQLQQLHTSDSIQIAGLQQQLDHTQDIIDEINTRYNKIRTQLNSSTVDNRVQFLSRHLPQSSGSR